MADTIVPTVMGIVDGLGGSGSPDNVVDALLLLADVIDGGGVSDDEVAQAVSDWIEAHPEAVTTVQDGAITAAKLNADVLSTSDIDALFE